MGYTGSMYMKSGFNQYGLFMELNSGLRPVRWLQTCDKYLNITRPAPENVNTNLEIFLSVQNSSNMNALEQNFKNARNLVGTIINAADKEEANSFNGCLTHTR